MVTESALHVDRLWRGARLATMACAAIDDGLIACRDGRIVYAGPAADAPAFVADQVVDCEGRWVTPGLMRSSQKA